MKRRDFLIKGGVATLASAASTSLLWGFNPYGESNKNINLGIIGTGSRGSGLIPYINSIHGLNVKACCDILPFRLEEGIARSSGKVKGYTDYRRLLEDKDIDAVLVATPFSTHAQIEIDALDAGKHVYGEKTLAKGYSDITKLVNKAKSTNLIFQTGHQLRSSKLHNHVLKLIKGGKIGEIASFECQYNRNDNWRRPVPSPELEKIINWRMYREFSGGLLAELSSHHIDFVNWVLNENPAQVMGAGGINFWKDGRETYDNIHLIYDYPTNGVRATFTCLTTNAHDNVKIKVLGSKGSIIMDHSRAWFYPENNEIDPLIGEVDGVSGATIQTNDKKGYSIEIEHADPSLEALIEFKKCITNNRIPTSNIFTGAKTAIAVQMGLDAMYNNNIVDWDSNFKDLLKEEYCNTPK